MDENNPDKIASFVNRSITRGARRKRQSANMDVYKHLERLHPDVHKAVQAMEHLVTRKCGQKLQLPKLTRRQLKQVA